MDKHATIQEQLEVTFSVRSVPKLCKDPAASIVESRYRATTSEDIEDLA
jgi:hypothetical protein